MPIFLMYSDEKLIIKINIFFTFVILTLDGCLVGTIVSLPFKVLGTTVNQYNPDKYDISKVNS